MYYQTHQMGGALYSPTIPSQGGSSLHPLHCCLDHFPKLQFATKNTNMLSVYKQS